MEKDELAGHTLNSGSREEIIEIFRNSKTPGYYVCLRCTDFNLRSLPPVMRQRMGRTMCELCNELCYYDTKAAIPYAKIACSRCIPMDGTHEKYADQDRLAEIRRYS